MEHVGTYTVSSRGQLALPARARHRWGLDDGGQVDVIDLGNLVVLIPSKEGSARRFLDRLVPDALYVEAAAEIDDADLVVP